MNLLLINNGYPSNRNPQYSTYIKSIHECLTKAGFNVILLTLDTNFDGLLSKISAYIKFYYKLLILRDLKQYDWVYLNNYPHLFLPLVIVLTLKSYDKWIIHWHGNDINPVKFSHRLLNRFSYIFIPKRVIHIAPSEFYRKIVSKKLKINEGDIFVSPSGGIDLAVFPKKEGKLEGPVKIGFASSLTWQKGIDLIIDLFNSKPYDCELHYINYGKEKEKWNAKLALLPIRTVQYGPFKKGDMYRFYQNVDILILPTRAESLGLVCLEALSCGIPVIATGDFALTEYIISGITGETFDLNVDSINSALQKAIGQLDSYSPRSFVAANYSREVVIAGYKKLLS